jgi:hypothetical protein
MATGEYVSVRSQRELFEYQIGLERDELRQYPEAEAQELAFEWTAEHRRVRRLRALLEGMPFKLGKAPERLVVLDQVQAQSGDLQGPRVFGGVGLHGLILENRSSKPTRRALMNPRPSGRK